MTDVWRLSLQAPRKMVLLALADSANDEGTDCWPSVAKLVEKCSMSERAVQGHLTALEADGFIKRHERLGRSNKFVIFVERIRSELMAKRDRAKATPAKSAPPQILHPSPKPHGINTPAESAPPQRLHPSSAESAPITTIEPSLKTTTTPDGEGGCGEDLIFPAGTPEEIEQLRMLMMHCPSEYRQLALDEVEGARQAGIIKTSLIPFARGIANAIRKGTFTVGHGTNVAAQRVKIKSRQAHRRDCSVHIDPSALEKGRAFMARVAQR